MGVFSKVTTCLFLTKCVTERTNAQITRLNCNVGQIFLILNLLKPASVCLPQNIYVSSVEFSILQERIAT